MYPASITKVMTAIIAIEEGNLSDAVTANDDVVIHEAGASMVQASSRAIPLRWSSSYTD